MITKMQKFAEFTWQSMSCYNPDSSEEIPGISKSAMSAFPGAEKEKKRSVDPDPADRLHVLSARGCWSE